MLYEVITQQKTTLAFLAMLMLLVTGIVTGSNAFAAFITMVSSIIVVYVYIRFGWLKLALAFIFIIYLAHSNWLLNNPITGNPLDLTDSPGISYLNFLASAIVFSLLAIVTPKETTSRA